jgi:maltooligosyltrehalose trehalohydrolase
MQELGAHPQTDGTTVFRAWAPRLQSIAVRVGGGEHALQPTGDGVHEGIVPVSPGDDYAFVLDGGRALPDPCSRWQPRGLRGPSRIIERPSVEPFTAPALEDLVIYELHVGTFTKEGTFDAVIPRLGELAALGVTAIELMPVAEFPGHHGWGYDGVYISAAQSSYGGPHGLAELVSAAHREGLAVILDVVYNHVGASGVSALKAFGPYFGERTIWGPALDYSREAVREWILQSAEQWIRDFGIDGLRLDAIHAIVDPGPEHIVEELSRRIHALRADALVIGEIGLDDARAHGAPACDAIWDDHFHHALHVLLTDEHDGYYESFGRVQQLADALGQTPPERFVAYAQNHDQVGNRALGDRLEPRRLALAALCLLCAPFVPLLFMGEEYGERAPFQFFSDHIDPKVADATRVGRREEFADFVQFAEDIPDPQDPETFERSKLTRRHDPEVEALYRELLRVRKELPSANVNSIEFDERARWLRFRRGPFEVVCNFGAGPLNLACAGNRIRIATDRKTTLNDAHLDIPALSGALIE